jgi:N-methylhydantoinase A
MLASPVTREVSRTVLLAANEPDSPARIAAGLAELEADARAALHAEGIEPDDLTAEQWIDARYRGQSFELGVPADNWVRAFHAAHLERYGYERLGATVEAVTLRAVVRAPAPELEALPLAGSDRPPASRSTSVVFGGARLEARRLLRADLRAGHELVGPLVIQEYSGTTWVPPGWRLGVDRWGCLHLSSLG